MDDRLRVHDDVDAVVRRAEQVVGLDDLEALVHQRRRVDGDLAAHRPRRVLERLLDGDVLELGARAPAERAARRGEHELVDRARRLAGEQLVQRGVLGVDGDDLRAGGLGERHDELAADDERLLVGQREVDALPQRRDRRAEPRGADQRVEDEVGARLEHEPHEPLGPAQHLAVGPRLGGLRGGVRVGQRDPRRRRTRRACATSGSHDCSAPTARRARTRRCARATSSAWVPIEPVEPRMSRRRATERHYSRRPWPDGALPRAARRPAARSRGGCRSGPRRGPCRARGACPWRATRKRCVRRARRRLARIVRTSLLPLRTWIDRAGPPRRAERDPQRLPLPAAEHRAPQLRARQQAARVRAVVRLALGEAALAADQDRPAEVVPLARAPDLVADEEHAVRDALAVVAGAVPGQPARQPPEPRDPALLEDPASLRHLEDVDGGEAPHEPGEPEPHALAADDRLDRR